MKKYLFGAVLSLALLASPAFTQAAGLTQDQINSILSLLQSFGADQTTINNVQISLNGGTPTTGGGEKFCYDFNRDLTIGSSGDDVVALIQALIASGITVTGKSATFTEDTAAAVVQFQAKYGIRQTGYVGPITRAKLNALYGCSPNFPPPPPVQPAPTATLSANGGTNVTVNVGDTINYTWNSTNGTRWNSSYIATGCANAGSNVNGATWKPADGWERGTIGVHVTEAMRGCTIFISYNVYGAGGNARADITVNVATQTTTPSITILSPTAGMTYTQGQPMTISWYSNPVTNANSNYEISYNSDFGSTGRIIIGTFSAAQAHCDAADKCYISWTPNFISQSVGIVVHDLTQGVSAGYGHSGSFAIVAPNTTTPSITVLSPNGGETISPRQEYLVRWRSNNVSRVRVSIFSPTDLNGLKCVIGDQLQAYDGSRLLFFGAGCVNTGGVWPDGQYKMRIEDASNTSTFDDSDATFSIVAGTTTTPSITVLSPNGGEQWQAGSNHVISWSGGNPADRIGITLLGVGYTAQVLGSMDLVTCGNKNAGNCSWGIPSSITPGSYIIRVCTLTGENDCTLIDFSDAPFSIVAASTTANPLAIITDSQLPDAKVGQPYSVTLNTSGVDPSNGYNWSVNNGASAFPVTGLSFGPSYGNSNNITGIPAKVYVAGVEQIVPYTFTFTVTVNSGSQTATKQFTLTVNPATNTTTPLTLTNITPSSGPVGTSVRLDGCGSDSASGFTLVYSGPKSGSIVIPVETYGGAGNICGSLATYVVFKFTVPADFPVGTYTLSVKNNQTGAVSTNTKTFTVTSNTGGSYYPATFSVSPTTFAAGASVTISVANAAPNATIKVFCRDPNGVVCDDPVSYTANSSGQFSHTYNTTGWTVGKYYGWVTANSANPFWSWRSVDTWFTVTAPVVVNNPVASVSPTSFAAGASFTASITGAAPNATIHVFSTDPNGVTSEDLPAGTTNASGQFSRTHITTGWPAGSYRGWVTVNGVQSNTVTFTVGSVLGASTFTHVWNRDLQIGSPYPDDIAALQQALAREGVYAGEITGGFYNQTYAAVKTFQQKHGIEATGYVGPLTRAELNTLFAR